MEKAMTRSYDKHIGKGQIMRFPSNLPEIAEAAVQIEDITSGAG